MASKRAHDAAKKKAAKEKKMLVVLGLVLVVALGYAYKTMMKLHGASPAPNVTPAATTTTSASTTPSGGVDVPATTAAPSSRGLVAAVKPVPDQGQLVSFTLFAGKDPFNSDGPRADATGTTPTQPTPTQTMPKPKSTKRPSGAGSSKFATPLTSAVISVNGAKSLVSVGGAFPDSSRIFVLVSLTKSAGKIGLAGGSYVSGESALTLRVGHAVTLENTTDGKRYTLELFPQGTAAPPVEAPPVTSTTPTPMGTPPS